MRLRPELLRTGSRWGFGGALAALALALTGGCFSSKPVTGHEGVGGALGSFELTVRGAAPQTLTSTACSAGGRWFLGADFLDAKTRMAVRLLEDPIYGPVVRVFDTDKPGDRSWVFHRADCVAFRMSLDPSGWRINGVDDFAVELELDCSVDEARVKGQAGSTHCH